MYGREEAEWDDLVASGTAFLIDRVRLGRPTSYTELNAVVASRTGHRAFDFDDASERAAMGELLGRIVEADYPTRRYMLSALVIYLNGNDPGPGFYSLATQMGLLAAGEDKLAFWTAQTRGLGLR